MSNQLLKHIIGSISSEEVYVLKDKFVNEEIQSENERRRLFDSIQSLSTTRVLCSPYVDANHDYSDDIKVVGIDNVCRFYCNLCSQYARLKGVNYSSSALQQNYLLYFNGSEREVPLSTRSGDPSDYIDGIIGIPSGKLVHDYSEEELDAINKEFGDARDFLKDTIDNCDGYYLPHLDRMSPEQSKQSLHALVDRGNDIIQGFIDTGLKSMSDSTTRGSK